MNTLLDFLNVVVNSNQVSLDIHLASLHTSVELHHHGETYKAEAFDDEGDTHADVLCLAIRRAIEQSPLKRHPAYCSNCRSCA